MRTSRPERTIGAFSVIFVSVIMGCGGEGTDNSDAEGPPREPSSPEESVQKMISSEGGTLELDGAVTLEIPEGALSSPEELTISIADRSPSSDLATLENRMYEFGPEGLTFEEPITVRFQHDGASGRNLAIYWTQRGGDQFKALPTAVRDEELVARVDHFSLGAPVRIRSCQTDAECPGVVSCRSGLCYQPDCQNGRRDGLEMGTDCGGPICSACPSIDAGMDVREDSGMLDTGTRDTGVMDTDMRDTEDGGRPDTEDARDGSDIISDIRGPDTSDTSRVDTTEVDIGDTSDADARDTTVVDAGDVSDVSDTDTSDADTSDTDATDVSDATDGDISDGGDTSDTDATDASDTDATDALDTDATDASDTDATDASDTTDGEVSDGGDTSSDTDTSDTDTSP